MSIKAGEAVVVVLHTPREKLFGLLDEITAAGISLRGVELGYFDDLCRSIVEGEQYLPLSDQFLPMWRVERVTKDERSGDIPSMLDQFALRTGKEFGEI